MSSKWWLAACTGVQARDSAQKSPDFAPTLRDSGFAGGLRHCGYLQGMSLAAHPRLASHPA